MLNKFRGAYQKAPFFKETFPLLERILTHKTENLFDFLFHSLRTTAAHLLISDNLVVSSAISANHHLKGQDRVISICSALGATEYVNPEGGVDLYSRAAFSKEGIELEFLRVGHWNTSKTASLFATAIHCRRADVQLTRNSESACPRTF